MPAYAVYHIIYYDTQLHNHNKKDLKDSAATTTTST